MMFCAAVVVEMYLVSVDDRVIICCFLLCQLITVVSNSLVLSIRQWVEMDFLLFEFDV